MQTRPQNDPTLPFEATETAEQRAARLLPGPHSVLEQAALEASIAPAIAQASGKGRATAARMLVGTAAIAFAVTIPDLSAGAMDSSYLRINIEEPNVQPPQQIWSPAVGAPAPVYFSVIAAQEIAPASLTYVNRPRTIAADQTKPLNFLATGSERFNLAFGAVEMPFAAAFTISPGLPDPAQEGIAALSPALVPAALRARLIDVPQIANYANLAPRPASNARPAGSASLVAGSQIQRSVAAANESVAAAFAGTLDVSGGMREVLPISPVRQPNIPQPVSERVARAIPASARAPAPARVRSSAPAPISRIATRPVASPVTGAVTSSVSASATGVSGSSTAPAELEQKSDLGARVNGVMTGRIDFKQLDGTIAIRLGSVVDLLSDRFSASELEQIARAGSMGSFVPLAEFQAAGIPVNYNPVYDELEFGIDYDDAPLAAKVQVEQIGAPSLGTDRTLIDQIPS